MGIILSLVLAESSRVSKSTPPSMKLVILAVVLLGVSHMAESRLDKENQVASPVAAPIAESHHILEKRGLRDFCTKDKHCRNGKCCHGKKCRDAETHTCAGTTKRIPL